MFLEALCILNCFKPSISKPLLYVVLFFISFLSYIFFFLFIPSSLSLWSISSSHKHILQCVVYLPCLVVPILLELRGFAFLSFLAGNYSLFYLVFLIHVSHMMIHLFSNQTNYVMLRFFLYKYTIWTMRFQLKNARILSKSHINRSILVVRF